MPSEFAPPGGTPRVTKKQIREIQENYKKAAGLAEDLSDQEAAEKQGIDDQFAAAFEEVFVETESIGIYIGRFQPFHNGHEIILESMLRENSHSYIFVGIGGELAQNPFPIEDIQLFLQPYQSEKLSVQIIQDTESDKDWVENIFSQIDIPENIENIIVYCGDQENDSSIKSLKQFAGTVTQKTIEYRELNRKEVGVSLGENFIPLSATICRLALEKNDFHFLEKAVPAHVFDFLQGGK